MTGFVYKELKQNLRYILLTVVSGFVALIVLIMFRDSYNAHDYNILLMLGLIGGLLLAGGMEMAVLNGDDRKLWAYFVSSTSDGYKGFLRVKYEMIFVMSLLFLTSFSLCEQLITAIAADKGMMVESSASAIAVPLVFIQFLQKKGWMGCSAGESWNDGDKEFVQNLFANTTHKNTFVDDVLEPLFNEINFTFTKAYWL